VIDPATLAAFAGTYRFASSSSRDKLERREFGGLGIEIAMQDGHLKVLFPIRDAPAARAGVIANDVITHLDDAATQGMTLNQALEKMRGPVDTTVRLKIARKGQDGLIELTIARAVIRPEATGSDLQVAAKDGKLLIEGRGALPVLDFEQGAPIAAVPMSSNEFVVDGGDHTRMAFLKEGAGQRTDLVLNPGPWQITGQRIN
jgi:C-terminal processing protease CtpA/Prc